MISSLDIEYIEAKLIKQGKTLLDEPFEKLANTLFEKFGVKPMTFHYDILEHSNRPRLQVIFETSKQAKAFHKNGSFFYDLDKKNRIWEIFHELMKDNPNYRTDNLFVISGTFEKIAIQEANSKIPKELLEELKTRLNNQDIWEISKTFSSAIFFFHTDKQVEEAKNSPLLNVLENEYYKLIKRYDEFNYLELNQFGIGIDSRENFVNNYQSNWFYYFKDH